MQGSSVTTRLSPVSRQLTDRDGRRSKGQHLGVSGRILVGFAGVSPGGDHQPRLVDHDSADRDVGRIQGKASFIERAAHPFGVRRGPRQGSGPAQLVQHVQASRTLAEGGDHIAGQGALLGDQLDQDIPGGAEIGQELQVTHRLRVRAS